MAKSQAGGTSVPLGDLYSKCVQMVNENKISTKNAFEIPLIDHINDIVSSFMGGGSKKRRSSTAADTPRKSFGGDEANNSAGGDENRFHEASCTIEASARIYSCRVDCVHTDTYRILGGLSSADMGDDDGAEGDGPGAKKRRRICGVNTLEKNEASIIQQVFEADEQSDPSFRRMAAAFDAGGARGLLLSHLPIAEDLSLVFNGDVPLSRAQGAAKPMFETTQEIPQNELGFGDDSAAACRRFADARLCPEVLGFRHQLLGPTPSGPVLPDRLESLLVAAAQGSGGLEALVASTPAAMGGGFGGAAAAMPQMPDMDCPGDDLPEPMDFPSTGAPAEFAPQAPFDDHRPGFESAEMSGQIVPHVNEDAIAFDDLFQKFCGGGKGHQFAYFDECWSKQSKDKDGKALQPVQDSELDGQLVAADGGGGGKEKPAKRPLFDLSGLDKPPRPIETEPVAKHQLSERATHWQLHKDVPPYMIDRITMPSWPTWSKCDFACLGLRPHLMLKLQRKPAPETAGPHSFSDLFQTVVVENPEAFPWLASEARGGLLGRGHEDEGGARRRDGEDHFGEEGDDGENGLPSHLDVNPQDLFLHPDDRVLEGVSGGDDQGGDFGDVGGGMGDFPMEMPEMGGDDNPLAAGLDFDLADAPTTVGNTEINYSRNSKFVDVKLVKKHLWDCISEEIEAAKKSPEVGQASPSFQDLVQRTVRRLPKAETGNLSVAVCFICALHLCNEKGLELRTEVSRPQGDFDVVGPPSK